jgi:hypothetical protein
MPSRKDLTVRLATPLLTAAALLALVPGAAHAKELASARACDDDGCRTITAKGQLRGMEEGEPTSGPAKGAPFYRVHMRVRIEGQKDSRFTLVYVPSGALLRVQGQYGGYDWLAATPNGRRGFERLTRGLEPLPARRLRGVGADAAAPVAQVDEVVAPPTPGDGGFPWTVILIPGALALGGAALAARRATKPRLGRTGAQRPLARDDAS